MRLAYCDARALFYSSVRDHVYDIFIERGASLESDYDMTVRKCHRRPRILQTASCVCIGGASAVAPKEMPTRRCASSQPAFLDCSLQNFCDTQFRPPGTERQTPRKHSQTFSPILLHPACSQQRYLTGTPQGLAHVSSHARAVVESRDQIPRQAGSRTVRSLMRGMHWMQVVS